MYKYDRHYCVPKEHCCGPAARGDSARPPLRPRINARRVLITTLLLTDLWLTGEARAGSTMNAATVGATGTAVTVSNTAATKLLNASTLRYSWTIYCAGTAGSIAALMMPGDSAGSAASPAPSQTVGFPIPANSLVTNLDYALRGLDGIHQRIDAEALGSSAISCYTWEQQ